MTLDLGTGPVYLVPVTTASGKILVPHTKAEYQALTKGILPCAGCGKPKSACGCS